MTQKLFIPIGLPSCGKTTYFFNNLSKQGILRISRDSINEMLSGDIYTDNINKICRAGEQTLLQESLVNGYSVFIDRVNLTPKSRKRFINKAKNFQNKLCVIGIFFQSCIKTCLNQNEERIDKTLKQRQELEDFIPKANQFLIPPNFDEGFYEIHYINKQGNIEKIENDKNKE